MNNTMQNVIKIGKPPALQGDSQSLTVPGLGIAFFGTANTVISGTHTYE